MKNLKVGMALVLFAMLMPLVSNAQEPVTTLEFKNAAKALEVVQKYTKALQTGDVATMNAQLAP